MPKLSIIVPVYRVEAYLPKCIESILAQTFTDFELILIDDGSPDRCGEMCDEYARRDGRITVIHQENAGVSAARNRGLDMARGEYIGFVDSDDWIEPNMYETMLREAENGGLDVVCCDIIYVSENGQYRGGDFVSSREYKGNELLRELFGKPNRVGGAVWNKLFRKPLVEKKRFRTDVSMAEDWLFLFSALSDCKSGKKIEPKLYIVREREGSATRSENVRAAVERITTSEKLLLMGRKHSKELEKIAIDKYLDDCVRYLPEIRRCGKATRQPYLRYVVQTKRKMLHYIALAWRRRLLSASLLVRYVYLCIKT